MTNRLHRLESAGLVRRRPDPADGRVALVELTPRGREVLARAGAVHLANERAMLRALGAQERATLASLLRTLLVDLEDVPAQA